MGIDIVYVGEINRTKSFGTFALSESTRLCGSSKIMPDSGSLYMMSRDSVNCPFVIIDKLTMFGENNFAKHLNYKGLWEGYRLFYASKTLGDDVYYGFKYLNDTTISFIVVYFISRWMLDDDKSNRVVVITYEINRTSEEGEVGIYNTNGLTKTIKEYGDAVAFRSQLNTTGEEIPVYDRNNHTHAPIMVPPLPYMPHDY